MPDRRRFLKLTASAALGAAAVGCRTDDRPRWDAAEFPPRHRPRTAILTHADYDDTLPDTIFRGIGLFDLDLKGRRVVLKPNLVEFDPHGVINTHPAVIAGAIEAFRRKGAAEVVVAEGPGHRRDNEYLLEASGLDYTLRHTRAAYVDLNTDDLQATTLRTRFTGLGSLYLPRTILGADLIVSMPKLKTHKWAGATLSMKNMFGIVPGSVYGWPKNLLHWHGIGASIIDINAALPIPRFNIVDGIVGMEGNGPIQGDARRSGVLVFGEDAVAVDATAARLMGIDPLRMPYLEVAGRFLGQVEEGNIQQVAETVSSCRQDYKLLDHLAHLRP